ncbi:MAG TPA: hypothetical protein V6D43_07900 [Candidatus Sericytochromatia bacterium]
MSSWYVRLVIAHAGHLPSCDRRTKLTRSTHEGCIVATGTKACLQSPKSRGGALALAKRHEVQRRCLAERRVGASKA